MPRVIDREVIIAILRVLSSCGSYPVSESLLFTQVNSVTPWPVPTQSLHEHLAHAKEKGWIDYRMDEIDGAQKWFLTEAGKTTLANS